MPPSATMPVPGASSLMTAPSLSDQVGAETEEQRKKRMQAMQSAKQMPVGMSSLAGGYGDALSMA